MQQLPEMFNSLLKQTFGKKVQKQIDSAKYYFGNLDLRDTKNMTVICAGSEICTPSYSVNRDGFLYYALEYFPEGEWELEYEGNSFRLGENSLFVCTPKSKYKLNSLNEKPRRKFFIDFIGNDTDKYISTATLQICKPIRISQSGWMYNLLTLILNCDYFDQLNSQEIATSLLHTIFKIAKVDISSRDASGYKLSYQKYIKSRAYINEYFRDINNNDDILKACHIQRSYLCKLFNEYANTTPLKYATELKIRYAADLMIRQKISVKEASSALGFNDQYYFSRVFKRVMGVSPKKYINSIISEIRQNMNKS